MKLEQLPLGPLGTNCYIIKEDKKALIVDPGGDADKLIRMIERRELQPVAILLTHAHFDHIGALDEVRDHFEIEVYMHEEEQDWLMDPEKNGSALFGMVTSSITARKAEHFIGAGTTHVEGFSFETRYTPGHSPGSISFIFHDAGFAVVGDTLFAGGIGRTDLPGGNMETLLSSINTQLLDLPNNMEICPGHGDMTTVEVEREENPFLN
ncbi:MBL fold metallo-hydrolase [Pontibacillus yanchengensis]|uniref:Metallo-beta-lactamase domain-containing protein n=1 Tax=Pontibacillus yanchengensis Y32 TaxID=1385514 RepID=A0A0A2TUJ6_9BACI|nr:MBL fold metallo-hydrolase [Pontibacillus yanchengensis]KGP72955.1 hypothetical protein N782_08605 [Pontibacillus yanchengensis Y32]